MIRPINSRIDFSHPRHKPVTLEEERLLCARASKGDKAARDRLVNANMRFVMGVAKQFSGLGVPLEDLVNEGAVGLIRAVGMYDPTTPYRFVSYAVWWVRQAMTYSLQHQATTIRTPALTQLNKEMRDAEASGDEARVAKVRGKIAEISLIRKPCSMAAMLESGLEPIDQYTNSAASTEQYCRSRQVKRYLSTLPEVDRVIINRAYGINQGNEEALQEIGDSLGISRERVRMRKFCGIRKLQRLHADALAG